MVDIISTPGASNANSYGSLTEANDYFASRAPLSIPWDPLDDDVNSIYLVMACRVMESILTPKKELRWNSGKPYYYTYKTWTGLPSTEIQSLSWPRKLMYNRNGFAIANNVIPIELKYSQFEFAGQLKISDSTLNNDIVTQGITSVRAGSVALTFKDTITPQVLPDMVLNLLSSSWLTDEIIDFAVNEVIFEAG